MCDADGNVIKEEDEGGKGKTGHKGGKAGKGGKSHAGPDAAGKGKGNGKGKHKGKGKSKAGDTPGILRFSYILKLEIGHVYSS